MGFLTKLLSGEASGLVSSLGDVIDNITTTKEEKLNLDLEMKKAELLYSQEMKKLSVEERKLQYADTESARHMASVVQQSESASKLSKNISPILAILTTALTFFLFYMVIFKEDAQMIQDKKDIIIYILGALSAIVTQIFSFYFGSSEGSTYKNKIFQAHIEKSVNK